MQPAVIGIVGARQNNLKGFDLDLPLGELIVVTGVSGSGKSSLAFDTLYAEGQRRYVETFSPYARQFLDRMDKPHVERISGIPPAIAIDQTNPVRTSRSTVGTMTELNDHLKLLFARAARLHCRGCDRVVRRDSPDSIYDRLAQALPVATAEVLITFPVAFPAAFAEAEVLAILARQGYTRVHARREGGLDVIQDRVALARRGRAVEALEAALKAGHGRVSVYPLDAARQPGAALRFSSDLHCPDCDLHDQDPTPNLFSFNSPIGACPACRGFGRIIGVDYDLVIPKHSLSLAQGAIKPWQTSSYKECQDDLARFARRRGIPLATPWRELTPDQRQWVIAGEGPWEDGVWYGVQRFFDWLEGRAYKMHIRVLLSRYRAYRLCPACGGARLKPEALRWRVGPGRGLTLHDVMLLPITACRALFEELTLPRPLDAAAELLLTEIRTRLRYLVEVGLGYLTLDRQSRTLSGGEVQRINLTTALGASLVNTLFVLDEPSIGLHPRDIGRLIGVLHRLRDAGNTLVVVEHDPAIMRAADRIVDLGPGPGSHGGTIVFNGTYRALLRDRASLTAQYLSGRRTVAPPRPPPPPHPPPPPGNPRAAGKNLKDLDVTIPLNRLVCITGVSGSGKSTLVETVCFRSLRSLLGRPVEAPGRHTALEGAALVGDVVLVDQSPIGKTARSNPASYVGAFDALRALFAVEPLARERGYTAGTFSFNAGTGRCPTCEGSGFEHVEMQFLSDVYLRCPDCDGRRYRPETLEVKLHGRYSIADVLELTAADAAAAFADEPDVVRRLQPLLAVGLGYLRLGQPVPTLSGGEAQRLKLAGYLAAGGRGASAGTTPRTLFLFDEPTTGLHADDTATLLKALRQLLAEGHSVVVIEHNLDVLHAADWLIDLGPEGGAEGGALVCAGPPETVAACTVSHTGAALRAARGAATAPCAPPRRQRARDDGAIQIHRAREHNLRNIDVRLPRDVFTVITGVSGSGKSTLAFDILFAEGQRRYLESLNAYARQFVQPAARPDVDALFGIPPTVAIEQRTSRGGRKSTVATVTEIYHFLRLLFVKLGVQHCPDCHVPIQSQTAEAILARLQRDFRGRAVTLLAPLVTARKGYYTDLARWAAARGFTHLRVDGTLTPTAAWPRLDRFREHTLELPVATLTVNPAAEGALRAAIERTLGFGKGVLHVLSAAGKAPLICSTLRACHACGRSFAEPDPRLFSFNSAHGWCPRCFGTGLELAGFDANQTGEEIWWTAWWEGPESVCRDCHGERLRPEARAVTFRDRSITTLTRLTVTDAERFFRSLKLHGREAAIARDIVTEVQARLAFLRSVGLDYLALDRSATTLSGGEAQRIRLASQLGSNLRGVCYILDEPTIGLHARDNLRLLDTLRQLEAKGNTVVVVEHDEETIRRAEHIVDLGPGAGRQGGSLVAQGTVADIIRAPDSLTGRCLAHPMAHPLSATRRATAPERWLTIAHATLHNLRKLTVRLPLERLVCVTGVSGSGKSTLVRDVLHTGLKQLLAGRRTHAGKAPALPGGLRLEGWEAVDRVLEVDQTPIGNTPRSCPATYVGIWDDVRRLFAATPEARLRGYGPGRFSFNVAGGRCAACEGQGVRTIEMSFLPDVTVTCEECAGRRFNPETLAVRYKERTISEVLAMPVDEAAPFFAPHAAIHHALSLLQDVGLGYLTLGQQSPTLSGGEAQRVKLVTELAKARPAAALRGRRTPHTLYVLDEPTIGLHMADVAKLVVVLQRLVDAGNTVVLIEHNLDLIAEADWILDLGPEGGAAGGKLVAEGSPEALCRAARRSHTARFLKPFLARLAPPRPSPAGRAAPKRRQGRASP